VILPLQTYNFQLAPEGINAKPGRTCAVNENYFLLASEIAKYGHCKLSFKSVI